MLSLINPEPSTTRILAQMSLAFLEYEVLHGHCHKAEASLPHLSGAGGHAELGRSVRTYAFS